MVRLALQLPTGAMRRRLTGRHDTGTLEVISSFSARDTWCRDWLREQCCWIVTVRDSYLVIEEIPLK